MKICHVREAGLRAIISEDMCGISIYLPGKSGMELAEEMFLYITCGYEENYLKFVYNYAKILDDELEINLEAVHTKYDEETRQIQFQINPGLADQIATTYIPTAYQSEGGGADLDAFLENNLYHMGETVLLKDYNCDLELQDVAYADCFYGLMI